MVEAYEATTETPPEAAPEAAPAGETAAAAAPYSPEAAPATQTNNEQAGNTDVAIDNPYPEDDVPVSGTTTTGDPAVTDDGTVTEDGTATDEEIAPAGGTEEEAPVDDASGSGTGTGTEEEEEETPTQEEIEASRAAEEAEAEALLEDKRTAAADRSARARLVNAAPLSLGATADEPPVESLDEAIGDTEIPSEVRDSSGNLVSSVTPVPEGGEPPGGTVVTDYQTIADGQTGIVVVNTYNAEGEIVSTSTTQSDADGNQQGSETVTYEVDDNGEVQGSTTTVYSAQGEPIGQYNSTYEHNEQGQITGRTTDLNNETGASLGQETISYQYNQNGQLEYSNLLMTQPDGQVSRSEQTYYNSMGAIVKYRSTDWEGDTVRSSEFELADDRSGAIVRTDIERQNPSPPGVEENPDLGIIRRSVTRTEVDGSTNQVFEMVDPKTGEPTSKQTIDIATDGSITIRGTGEGGRELVVTHPAGTVQSFSETGSLRDGTRNLFEFGAGNIGAGIVQVEQIGRTVEPYDPKKSAFEQGTAKMRELAASSTNPAADLKSVIAAFGEFGREADDPRNTRPDPMAGVERYLEIGEDAEKAITDLTSAEATLLRVGDRSFFTGTYRTQHVIGDGSTRRAIDTARADSPTGDVQGGIMQYSRYGLTFGESLEQIGRADPTSEKFADDRSAVISLHEGPVPAGNSAFELGTNVIEKADDTPGDKSLSNGMDNVLYFGDGYVTRAGERLREASPDGRAITGVESVRRISDDGTFRDGAEVVDAAGDGDIDKGIYGIKYNLGDGSFDAGGQTLKYLGDGSSRNGVEVSKVAGNGSAVAGMESINKNLGDGSGIAGARVLVQDLGDGSGMTGAKNLVLIGDGDAIVGAQTVNKVGGGSGVEGGRIIHDVLGDGSGTAGTESLIRIGDGSGVQGAEQLVRLGGGGPNDAPKGAELVNRLGGGSGVEGSKVLEGLGGGPGVPGASDRGIGVLETLGGGQYKAAQGVDYLETLGGGPGKAPAGAQIVTAVGGGDAQIGAEIIRQRYGGDAAAAYADLSKIDANDPVRAARLAVEAGAGAGATIPGDTGASGTTATGARGTALENGLATFARLGNGNIQAGAAEWARQNQQAVAAIDAQRTREVQAETASRTARETEKAKAAEERVKEEELRRSYRQGAPANVSDQTSAPVVAQRYASGSLQKIGQQIDEVLGKFAAIARMNSEPGILGPGAARYNALGQLIDLSGRAVPLPGQAVGKTGQFGEMLLNGRQLYAGITMNGRGDGAVNLSGHPNGLRQGAPGELNLSRSSNDAARMTGSGASGSGFDAGKTGFNIRAAFTYKSGGFDVTITRLADGRTIMTFTRGPGSRGTGFSIDANLVANGIKIQRGFTQGFGGDTAVGGKVTNWVWRRKGKRLILFPDRRLTGVEIALAVLLTSSAIARRLESSEKADATAEKEKQFAKQAYATLTRPTWLVRPNEDLVKLAQHLFHDGKLGYLIADLNVSQIRDSYVEGKRVVELKERQKIELPVWQDILQFKKQGIDHLQPEDLITVVTENAIDTELIHAALAPVMGIGKGTFAPGTLRPVRPGVLRPAMAAASVSQVVSVPTNGWAFADSGSTSVSLTVARRAAIAVVRATGRMSRKDSDQGPTGGAVVTRAETTKVKRLRPKYVG